MEGASFISFDLTYFALFAFTTFPPWGDKRGALLDNVQHHLLSLAQLHGTCGDDSIASFEALHHLYE